VAAAPAAAAGAPSSASTTAASRSLTTRSLPVPAPRRSGYRLRAGIYARNAEERRSRIEAAEIELVERDGRVYELRRLPSALTE
jgi:hypothetical protein